MTRTNCRHLLKNKDNLVYNYKLKKYEHMSKTPMRGDFYYLQSIKRDYLNMSLDRKSFIYYCRISVKESLNTDLKTSELMLGKYDKEVYQSCKYCHQVIKIKKGFKENAFIWNMCFKFLQNEDKINRQIHVIWSENQKYMVFTNLHCSYVDRIFRNEDIKDKYGEISQETIDIHMNAYLNY